MKKIFIPFFAFFIFTLFLSAQEANKEKYYSFIADSIVKSALTEQNGYRLLGELCKIGPRLSGSANSLKAIDWAKEKMKNLGFDSVWLQPVMVPHWERGNVESAVIISSNKYKKKKLSIASLGGSVGTDLIKGITAEVIEIHSWKELSEKKNEVKDKIVFFNIPFDNSFPTTFPAYGKNVGYRVQGASEAAKHGAKGMILRSISSRNDNVPHVGVMHYTDSIPQIPAIAIGIKDADFLSEALNRELKLKLQLKLSCKTLPDAQSYNVIGELKGTEFPNEVIVIGGHFDSWDKGDGAHDDAAGCIQSLEVLDLFKRLHIKPKRTIRCVFFINEENGSRGGIAYGEYAAASNEKHLTAIESDRGAFTPVGFMVDKDSLSFAKISSWGKILERAGIHWVKQGGSGVDVSYIKNAKCLIGYVPDSQRYFDYHHSANDVFSEINPREFELGSAAMAVLVYLIDREGL
ncbi:MAG: M20/M25/M40 family metallo-hydrolase [Ignavibacteriaceae bacterium]|jgi:hypothetical protein|nr:M20/M25/M40 family metallo-hydrolase [Ignavibacteriaceae bacterium]